jgi:hypothetical protein
MSCETGKFNGKITAIIGDENCFDAVAIIILYNTSPDMPMPGFIKERHDK